MKTKTTYSQFDLKKGICKCCGENSNKILIDDGRCTNCVEEEKFFEQIMRNKTKKYKLLKSIGSLALINLITTGYN
jgi:predicted ATP-dependent serine protease